MNSVDLIFKAAINQGKQLLEQERLRKAAQVNQQIYSEIKKLILEKNAKLDENTALLKEALNSLNDVKNQLKALNSTENKNVQS